MKHIEFLVLSISCVSDVIATFYFETSYGQGQPGIAIKFWHRVKFLFNQITPTAIELNFPAVSSR